VSIEHNFDIRFIASLALREKQIQQNYRPVIAVHKWFARRPGTLFRGLLLSEYGTEAIADSYYRAHAFPSLTIADPFMGGGTPLLEANRLGCNVVGTDINPMSRWIVREEIDSIDLAAYASKASELIAHLEGSIGRLYRTRCVVDGREDALVKYFLWVKVATCHKCSNDYDLFPGYLLAENVRHPVNVLVCRACGALNEAASLDNLGRCACGTALALRGCVTRGKATCPYCGDVASPMQDPDAPPRHRLFAIEYYNPNLPDRRGRLFKRPDLDDLQRVSSAAEMLSDSPYFPVETIPAGDESSRLHRWGYRRYRDLFNPRQLLGLDHSARFVSQVGEARLNRALATNFSDLLRYQNMLCRYDTMALKSLDVFSIHGFPVGYVQVESNLIGIRNANDLPVGSGGWVNITEKYRKAKQFCTEPFELRVEGRHKFTIPIKGEWIGEALLPSTPASGRAVDLRCESAMDLDLQPGSVDGVFTDPPYFGMVQYGELMEFCYVWLRRLVRNPLQGVDAASSRHAHELTGNQTASRTLEHFAEGLARAYARASLALAPGRPLVFTFHHNRQDAYLAAAMAILDAGLNCSASLPCPAEMGGSIHIHGTDSSIVDTVFVCRRTGKARRDWLVTTRQELVELVAREVADLSAAGMQPSRGDVRCVTFGHLARLAVWHLRTAWDPGHLTSVKLSKIKSMMDRFGNVNDLVVDVQTLAPKTTPSSGDLFSESRTDLSGVDNAVSF